MKIVGFKCSLFGARDEISLTIPTDVQNKWYILYSRGNLYVALYIFVRIIDCFRILNLSVRIFRIPVVFLSNTFRHWPLHFYPLNIHLSYIFEKISFWLSNTKLDDITCSHFNMHWPFCLKQYIRKKNPPKYFFKNISNIANQIYLVSRFRCIVNFHLSKSIYSN